MIKDLPVKLTPEEENQRKDELLATLDVLSRLEDEKKSFNAKWKEKEEEAQQRQKELRKILRAKAEDRPIKCVEEKDFERATVRIIRTDTYETIDSRAMTAQERQKMLDLSPAAPDDDEESEGDAAAAEQTPPPPNQLELQKQKQAAEAAAALTEPAPSAPMSAIGVDGKTYTVTPEEHARVLAGEKVFVEVEGVSYEIDNAVTVAHIEALLAPPMPPAPIYRELGIGIDKREYWISREEAEMVRDGKTVKVVVDADGNVEGYEVEIVLLKACPTCGAADFNHRAEAHALQFVPPPVAAESDSYGTIEEIAEKAIHALAEVGDTFAGYDANNQRYEITRDAFIEFKRKFNKPMVTMPLGFAPGETDGVEIVRAEIVRSPDNGAETIAKFGGDVPPLSDAPLVPPGDQHRPLVPTKPKRTKKEGDA